jgi:DmsE family decaheme c-type cytochrome
MMIRERFIFKSAAMGALAALLLVVGQATAADTAASDVTATETAASAPVTAEPIAPSAPAPVLASEFEKKIATYVGEKVCTGCHEVENNNFGHTLHSKVFRENPANDTQKMVCEACHGPGSLHAKKTKDHSLLIGFTKDWGTPVEKMNAQCLSCHKGGQRIFWDGSIHQKNKLACSDCHNPMGSFSTSGLLKKPSITETCQTCHPQQRAEFKKKSHMPVPEGKMTCEDCHNPHGSSSPRLLKADSVNDLCYSCHAEKRGPYLWEHAPVRENCMNCHVPHGSNNDKLLAQTRPMLCQSCHSNTGNMGHELFAGNSLGSIVNGNPTSLGQNLASGNQANVLWNSGAAASATNVNGGASISGSKRMIGRSCQNCHMQIHGSNDPQGARFQR